MKSKYLLRAVVLLSLLVLFAQVESAHALFTAAVPPADMFQLPWEQGKSWVAIDGFDNGTNRATSSPHYYLKGGAVDFAPHNNMQIGEDTSSYWVTAAAAGTVTEVSSCALKIDHGNGWVSDYQFLANIQVKVGDAVYRNQRLAVIADGLRQLFCLPILPEVPLGPPHLHFSLRPTMRNVTFAGWVINYVPNLNKTTFTRNGQTLGLFQPLLNAPGFQVVLREPITWDIVYAGSVDAYRYERWPFALTESTDFTLTTTPTTGGLIPLIVLLDANGNEITRSTGSLTSTQPAGNYFFQIQPQVGNGFYNLVLHKNSQPEPTGPYVSTSVTPTNINLGEIATATVKLGNVPAEGYTSAEFTCTYDASVVNVSSIVTASLFGADPVVAINGPQNGSFIVAIAGSKDNRATTSGPAFTFNVTGLQMGQTGLECKARISKGDNVLTSIQSIATTLTVLGSTPAPTPTSPPIIYPTPIPPSATPSPTPAPALCDQAEFVADANVPAGTTFFPGVNFTKTWRVKNVGTCVWTTAYQLVFFSGDNMGSPTLVAFHTSIAPNTTVDISVPLIAPSSAGRHVGYWVFRNANGNLFGTGAAANDPLLVDITVSGPSATPGGPTITPSPTPAPALCDKAELVADLITQPGAVILPGSYFAKGWRLKNVGTCIWTPTYAWTFVSGDQMDTNLSNTLVDNVYPGQFVEVFVSGVAPRVSGHYQSFWKLRNALGVQFGSGDSASDPFLLDIIVSGPTITPSLTASPTNELGWPVFVNSKYGFQFLYPSQSQIQAGRTDNYARIDLSIVQGTNLGHKYLEINVAENADPCRSPVAASSIVNSSGTVTINGLSFLKEIGGDAAAGNLYQFVAYSTLKDNVCVSLSFVLHSLNPGNFQTPPPVFDYAAETAVFDQIVSTYTWLALAPTPTPIITSTPGASPTAMPDVSPSPTETATHIPQPILTGQAFASKPVTVSLYDTGASLVDSTIANTDGTFSMTVASPGTYTVIATASGYLKAQGTVTLTSEHTTTLGAIQLWAGDIDGNNVIDQFDAMTIGMSYNTAIPAAADLNNDGVINVLDLELLANNYRKTGPVPWQ